MTSEPLFSTNTAPQHIAVIGAGPMGLACAWQLLKLGHQVTVFEGDDRVGGMSASFDFDGLRIERFFHFMCVTDHDYIALLQELGIEDRVHWVKTRMGLYHNGKVHEWGDPVSLLKFPGLSLLDKVRYGMMVLACKSMSNWRLLDHKRATTWLRNWLGARAYAVLWDRLMSLKFHELQHEISAAWIAVRVRRVAQSRASLFSEKLGYIKGGSEYFLNKLAEAIRERGGVIQLQAAVERVLIENSVVTGVRVNGTDHVFDRVVSTIPLPYVPRLVPDLPADEKGHIEAVRNVGVATVKFRLSQSLSPYFWLNVSDENIAIPGVIEYSNLNPLQDTVLYVPYYMPQTHSKFSWSDEQLVNEVQGYLARLNPAFSRTWVKATHVSRYFYAQPVCVPGFLEQLPPMKSTAQGFFMADTSFYYPEDRSITESIRMGYQLAELACAN